MNKARLHRGGVFRRLKTMDKAVWITITELLILLGICIFHSMPAGHYADFWPINGTFQNFNPVRRLFDGQVPYREFQVYLGLGHLYTGSVFTWIFGGSYRSSLIAFSFLTFLALALLFITIGNAIFKKVRISLAITNLVLLMIIIQPLFFQNSLVGTVETANALSYALGTGNSARFVRGMILPISCILFAIGGKVYDIFLSIIKKMVPYRKMATLSAVALIAGFSFVWSNDYGISCWLCIAIMTFVTILAREKNIKKALIGTVFEVMLSLAILFILVEIFTLGCFPDWFRSNFGTGGYQSWYYNSSKSYYLFDVDISYTMLIQACLCLAYLWRLFVNKGSRPALMRYGVLAYVNMSSFCAVNEYRLLSGGESKEVALAVLFATIVFELCYFIYQMPQKHTQYIVYSASIIVGFSWVISSVKDEGLFWKMTERGGEYIDQMGGNMTALTDDLKTTTDFLNGETFFATYASAQEVMTDTFQPSGTDYIIHVLGDSSREKYLNSFNYNDFKYAATQKETFTYYEYWIQRANWFFYRELYDKWHPIYSNKYETYWERNEKAREHTLTNEISVAITNVDSATKKLSVITNQNVNGIADLYINYAVKKKDTVSSKLLFRTLLRVESTGKHYVEEPEYESNFLRSSSKEYIPVTIVNGYGEVTLTSYPKRDTYFDIYAVNCSDIYTVPYDYIEVAGVSDSLETSVITVMKNAKTADILNGIKQVILAGATYNVSAVREDDSCFYVDIQTNGTAVNPNGNILEYNNILKIGR